MSLIDKIKKNSKIKAASVISESDVYHSAEEIVTNVPMINVALSGDLNGGFEPGLLTIAGPSKHFKSGFALILASAFQKKYEDGIILFYDSEFGTPQNYFKTFGVDMDRVVHVPIMNIEELKFDIMNQLESFEESDKVMILVDSIGNLASKKEIDDALDEKSVADMTRAKALKGLFRMVTPYLKIKKIPMVIVNHTYKEMCLGGDTLVQTNNGLKRIKNMEVGDYVLTNKKRYKKVLAKYNPEDLDTTGKEFYELTFEDGRKIQCTDNHKFLMTNGSWKAAKDITEDDEFMEV